MRSQFLLGQGKADCVAFVGHHEKSEGFESFHLIWREDNGNIQRQNSLDGIFCHSEAWKLQSP